MSPLTVAMLAVICFVPTVVASYYLGKVRGAELYVGPWLLCLDAERRRLQREQLRVAPGQTPLVVFTESTMSPN